MEYLPVTVDKSHLITIGERLYSESIELIRELVNNAYDADATDVDIKMTDLMIEVKDNGTGMDRGGLKQYFNIGSPEKTVKSKSSIFHRDLIGQFGIGKFASLSACECFEVYTQKGDFDLIVFSGEPILKYCFSPSRSIPVPLSFTSMNSLAILISISLASAS
jgi:HSP90 family molecular chaperone